MQGQGQSPYVGTYNTLMIVLYKVGNLKEAIQLFEQMKDRSHVPNMISYSTIMDALCKEGTPQKTNRILHDLLRMKMV